MDDMSSIYDNEKRNPPSFGYVLQTRRKEYIEIAEKSEVTLHKKVLGDSVLGFGGIAFLRHCVFFGVFSRCALVDMADIVVSA